MLRQKNKADELTLLDFTRLSAPLALHQRTCNERGHLATPQNKK